MLKLDFMDNIEGGKMLKLNFMDNIEIVLSEIKDFFRAIRLNLNDKIPQCDKWFIYFRVESHKIFYSILAYIYIFTGISFKIGGSKK